MELKTTYTDAEQVAIKSRLAGNWISHFLSPVLNYSHRDTVYTVEQYATGFHYHDYYEVAFIAGGDIRFHSGSAFHAPSYGDVIVIPPGKLHGTSLAAPLTRYIRYIYYLYEDALEPFGAGCLTQFLKRCPDEPFYFSIPQNQAREMELIHLRLDKALAEDTPDSLALARGLMIQLFYYMNLYSDKVSVFNETNLPGRLGQVQQYLEEHYAEPISIDSLSEMFFYSRSQLSRLFRQYFSLSIGEYLLKVRINAGKKMMLEPIPLSEICFRCGFGSIPSFIRAFHTETGLSPSQYRKQVSIDCRIKPGR